MEDPNRLLVYQKACALSREIGAVARAIARHRRKLAEQLDDAAESIASNIAEGCGRKNRRHGNAELVRYLHFSVASANECERRLCGVFDRSLISPRDHARLSGQVIEVRRMLIGLIRALEQRDRTTA